MERKLYGIMTIGGVLATVFGLWLLFKWHWPLNELWLQIKLLLVATLIAYHLYGLGLIRRFRAQQNLHTHSYYRWINEIPTLLLIAIVLLAILKPF